MADPITGALIGAGINLVGGLIGGSKSASAASKQAQMQNQAADRELAYNTEKWEMDKKQIVANRDHTVKEIEARARNEQRTALFKDASNAKQYAYSMQIRNREQESLNQQYRRSDQIYSSTLGLNAMSAEAGRRDEMRRLDEVWTEGKFDAQEKYVDSLIAEGKMRSMGASGRSADKGYQATLADYGFQLAALDESLDAAERNSRAIIEEIARDKSSADLRAYAEKMLDPGVLLLPVVPYKTPMAEFVMPREVEEYDFGPQPVLGAYYSPSAAAGRVWGSTISGIASGLGGLIAGAYS